MSRLNRKRKAKEQHNENEYDPISKHLVISHQLNQEKRLIVILEGAQLETIKVIQSKKYTLKHVPCPMWLQKRIGLVCP